VALVGGPELLLIGALDAVIELVPHPLPQLADDRFGVNAGGERPGRGVQQKRIVEVGPDRDVDTGVLHLDRHRRAVEELGPVDLADGCGGHRLGGELEEGPFRRLAELGLNDVGDEVGGHRRGALLKPPERLLVHLGQVLGHDREHLAELHDGALQPAEKLEDLLGGVDVELVELLLAGPSRPEVGQGDRPPQPQEGDPPAAPGPLEQDPGPRAPHLPAEHGPAGHRH
jgi:hypothetical protein